MNNKTFKEFKKNFINKDKKKEKYWENNFAPPFGKYFLKEILKIKNELNWKIADAHDLYVLSVYTGLSYKELLNNVVKGTNDGGIGSWYYNELKEELIFIQSKFKGLKNNAIAEMKDFYNTYIKKKKEITPDVIDTKEMVREIHKIMYEDQKIIKNKKFIGVTTTWNEGHQNKNIFSWEKLFKHAIENINKNITLSFSRYLEKSDGDGEGMVAKNNVYKIKINEILKVINKYNIISKECLFNANVRGDVTKTSKTFKKGFKKTLLNDPKSFEVFNNGITIVTEKADSSIGGIIKIVDPQIINGQQTMRNLMVLNNEINISDDAQLYVKIIETTDDNYRMKIAEYSNTQSSIKRGDLVSTTEEFKQLNIKCLESGYYLDAKQGNTLRKTIYKKMKLKQIPISQLAKIYISDKDPEQMHIAKSSIGKIKTYMIKESIFSKITVDDIKKYYRINEMRKEQIKLFKNENIEKYDENEAKNRNKIWSFAELAHFRLLLNNTSQSQIKEIIDNYRKLFIGDSLIQDFKTTRAYIKLFPDLFK